MQLHYRTYGEGPALIILHGLYGSSDNWVSIAKVLAHHFTVYLIDQRNHGQSPHSDEHNYNLLKNDLLEFMDVHSIEQAIIMGHSMGGKTAITFAAAHSERVEQLIVVDISSASYQNRDTIIKGHEIIIHALLQLDLTSIKNRKEADEQLSKYLPDLPLRQFLLKNLKPNKEKTFYWGLNIKTIAKEVNSIMAGIEAEKPITNFPVLFIKGADSHYIKESDIPHIKQLFPKGIIKTIPDAGHWVHAEQPSLFTGLLVDWLIR